MFILASGKRRHTILESKLQPSWLHKCPWPVGSGAYHIELSDGIRGSASSADGACSPCSSVWGKGSQPTAAGDEVLGMFAPCTAVWGTGSQPTAGEGNPSPSSSFATVWGTDSQPTVAEGIPGIMRSPFVTVWGKSSQPTVTADCLFEPSARRTSSRALGGVNVLG